MNTKEQLKGAKGTLKSARDDSFPRTLTRSRERGNERRTVPAAEGFMDKTDVADRLGVRPRTVGEWAKQGKIPAYRIGNYLRFKWAEIESHLAQSCRVATRANSES